MKNPTDERLAELTDKLENGIKELYASGKYAEYLRAMSKFHRYSFGNALLILFQCPTATRVAGYNTWKKDFGRNVKRHEKGIQILAPCPTRQYIWQEVTDPNTGKVLCNPDGSPRKETQLVTVTRFKVATVFDVSQTKGKELPTLGVTRMTGDVENFAAIYDKLTALSPVPVEIDICPGEANGYFSSMENRIVLRPGMSQIQTVKTLVHEIAHASLNFLVGMLYTQAFQELYFQADKVHGGALPMPVRLMFDEFANIALPDGYARLQATMRSRNIMATIILQNISQLKALFKDDWEGIIGNADAFIYLGGNEQSTHKYVSELLGKETIDTRSSSQSKGRNGSYSQSTQQTGRELLTPDEVRTLDNKNAIVLIRGERPVIDQKYQLMKHPNIKLTDRGGGSPYLHSPVCMFSAEDLSFTFSNLEELEIIEMEDFSEETSQDRSQE